MKKYSMRRAAAMAAAAVMAAGSVTGCASSTDYSITANGKKVNAGVYINYIMTEMTNQMYDLYYKGEITSAEECLTKEIEGKDFKTYVKEKALDSTKEFAAVQAKFDELGLSLSEEDVKNIDASVSSSWGEQKDFYEYEGVSKDSLRMCTEHSYKKEAIFDHYYLDGGEEAVSGEDIEKYVKDNYIRYKMLTIPKSTNEDEDAKNKENEELKTLWEGYISEAEGLGFDGFDQVIKEYKAYSAEKNAEAAKDSEAEDGETAIEGETASAEAAASESKTEETVTAVTAATAVEDETPAADTDSSDAEESEDTAVTTAAAEAPSEEPAVTSEETASEDSDETSYETDSEPAVLSAEDDGLAGNGAPGDDEEDPYENESVINYTDLVDPEYAYYNEDYAKVLAEVKNTEEGKVGSFENDNYYYIFITDSVTERADYISDNREKIIHRIKDDEFDGLVKGWIEAASITVNDKAVKRYTVQEVFDRQQSYSAKH